MKKEADEAHTKRTNTHDIIKTARFIRLQREKEIATNVYESRVRKQITPSKETIILERRARS